MSSHEVEGTLTMFQQPTGKTMVSVRILEDGMMMDGENVGMVGMANPASLFCVENSFESQIMYDPTGGEYALCVFTDSTACEEFAYLRAECGTSNPIFSSYCAMNDGDLSKESVDGEQTEMFNALSERTYEVCTVADIACTDNEYYTSGTCPFNNNEEVNNDGESLCAGEVECKARSVELGYPFYSGMYPTKGCFSKNEKLFYSPGTEEEMSTTTLKGVLERVYCSSSSLLPTSATTTLPLPIVVTLVPTPSFETTGPVPIDMTLAPTIGSSTSASSPSVGVVPTPSVIPDMVNEGITLENITDLSSLATLIGATGLLDELAGIGPFTLFAPNDDAISKFLSEGNSISETDTNSIRDIVLYHVVSGSYPSSSLTNGEVVTMNGNSITVKVSDEGVTVNDATVIKADIELGSGIVHVIDTVLTGSVEGGSSSQMKKPSTKPVVAPTTDEATSSPLESVASDNPTPSSIEEENTSFPTIKPSTSEPTVELNTASFINPNMKPGEPVSTTVSLETTSESTELVEDTTNMFEENDAMAGSITLGDLTINIAEFVAKGVDLTVFEALIEQTGLLDDLADIGPLTVFAPNDDAIAKFLKSLPDGKFNTTKKNLRDILLYHVVAGSYNSSSLTSGDMETMNGDTISVEVSDGSVMVNDAKVITADNALYDGIIHIIDKVLVPSGNTEEEYEDDENIDLVLNTTGYPNPNMKPGEPVPTPDSTSTTTMEEPPTYLPTITSEPTVTDYTPRPTTKPAPMTVDVEMEIQQNGNATVEGIITTATQDGQLINVYVDVNFVGDVVDEPFSSGVSTPAPSEVAEPSQSLGSSTTQVPSSLLPPTTPFPTPDAAAGEVSERPITDGTAMAGPTKNPTRMPRSVGDANVLEVYPTYSPTVTVAPVTFEFSMPTFLLNSTADFSKATIGAHKSVLAPTIGGVLALALTLL